MFMHVSMGTCVVMPEDSLMSQFLLYQLACELLLLLSLPPPCRSSRIIDVPSSPGSVWILRMLT